jgi:hypothetical protein
MSSRLRTIVPLLVFAGLLSGCASLSEKECLVADWYDVGVRDGAEGYGHERLIDHAKACADVNVQPDRVRWAAGRERGLERYCTPERGLWVGRNGGTYRGVCDPVAEEDFLRGYRLGREIAEVRGRIDALTCDIDAIDVRLDEGAADKDERRRLRARLVAYELERHALRDRFDSLEASAARL